MVRANDQGSHLPFQPQKWLWRRGVCLELDYRRTITPCVLAPCLHGDRAQEAQEL